MTTQEKTKADLYRINEEAKQISGLRVNPELTEAEQIFSDRLDALYKMNPKDYNKNYY